MAHKVKKGFRVEGVSLKLVDIVPSKQIKYFVRNGRKYKQIAASIAEVGIIEPLVVFPIAGSPTSTCCWTATFDSTFCSKQARWRRLAWFPLRMRRTPTTNASTGWQRSKSTT